MEIQIGKGTLYNGVELPEVQIKDLCLGYVVDQGITLVIGISKVGKTIAAIQVGKGLTKGDEVLGTGAKKCRLLYVVLERWNDFVQKYKTIRPEVEFIIFKYTDEPLILDNEKDTSGYRILKEAIEKAKADVVVIDSKYMTTLFRETSEYTTKVWLKAIRNLAKETGVAFLIIHHCPKQEYDQLINRAAGHSVLARGVDNLIGISHKTKSTSDKRRKFEFVSNAGYEPEPFTAIITDLGFVKEPEPQLQEAVTLLVQEIDRIKAGTITQVIQELAKEKNTSEATLWRAWKMVKPLVPGQK